MIGAARCAKGVTVGALFALAACVQPEPAPQKVVKAPPVPSDFTTTYAEAQSALAVVKGCPGAFKFNEAGFETAWASLRRKYVLGGKVPAWDNQASYEEAAQKTVEMVYGDFLGRYNYQAHRPFDWCRAGKTEIAERTAIGKYLIPR
ncbi:MAG: hypothetical protein JSR87_04910 [Proteobacteria bacterium]|nr:hypothetical protein [Pseudomonadota bacterium]MBS0572592.1 hypothetical protein [Pseudomonadota bacterium]